MTIPIEIQEEDAQDVFEILCDIPFEQATVHDSEPPTERHHGIESIIDQLMPFVDERLSLEDMLTEFIYKYEHEYDNAVDLSPYGIQKTTRTLVIEDLKRLLEEYNDNNSN
jgi:hypothetical protein